MDSAYTRAPAKINLTLEVGNKREDGYHLISSVMAHISLFDEISVTKSTNGIEFESNTEYLKNDDKNLCVLAAKKYFEYANVSFDGVLIKLKKVIPSKSGMGGGSADAAAVVELLERLFVKLDDDKKLDLGMKLGADVPFCMTKTPALCQGIGEIITPIKLCKKKIYVVVAKNSTKPSTSFVYSEFDKNPVRFGGSHADVIRALETGNFNLFSSAFNSFEQIIFPSYPQVKTLCDKMREYGALHSRMTGAGPTVFGLFDDKQTAQKALLRFREEKILSYAAYII